MVLHAQENCRASAQRVLLEVVQIKETPTWFPGLVYQSNAMHRHIANQYARHNRLRLSVFGQTDRSAVPTNAVAGVPQLSSTLCDRLPKYPLWLSSIQVYANGTLVELFLKPAV